MWLAPLGLGSTPQGVVQVTKLLQGLSPDPQLPPRFPPGRPPITTLLLRPNSSWSLDTAKWGMWGWGNPAHARTILAASRGPQTSDPPPPAPALPAPWAERSLLRRDKSARSPGTPRELPAQPRLAPPRPRTPGTRTGSRGATPIPARETAEGPRAVCGHSLGSEPPKPPPRTAFPDADLHLPKLVAGAAARAPRLRLRGARRPPTQARGGRRRLSAGSDPLPTSGAPPSLPLPGPQSPPRRTHRPRAPGPGSAICAAPATRGWSLGR